MVWYIYDENDKRPKGVNKKVIGMFKDELGGKIMKEFCALRAKTYTYLINFDEYVNENKTVHNKNWSCIPDHPYRILIIEN